MGGHTGSEPVGTGERELPGTAAVEAFASNGTLPSLVLALVAVALAGYTTYNFATELAEIGSAFGRCAEQYVTMDTEGLRVGLLSATAMLDHLDRGSIYKFLRTLMDRVERAGYLGVCTIDTAECNEQTVSMLADAFDAMVELRETVEGPEFRTTGLPAGRSWTPLSM